MNEDKEFNELVEQIKRQMGPEALSEANAQFDWVQENLRDALADTLIAAAWTHQHGGDLTPIIATAFIMGAVAMMDYQDKEKSRKELANIDTAHTVDGSDYIR